MIHQSLGGYVHLGTLMDEMTVAMQYGSKG